MLAQLPAVDPTFATLIGNFGVLGVLVWHMWYHTTKTYPGMTREFREELQTMRAAFLAEQKDSRVLYAAETAELRRLLITNLQEMRRAVHDVKDTANAAFLKQAAQEART